MVTSTRNKDIEILYRRQCEYSDYLDSLQRSSQRYYFLTLGAFIGILATIYSNMHTDSLDQTLTHNVAIDNLLGIASIGSIPLIIFGFITLLQLARLRALNLKTDRIIKSLEQYIASEGYIKNFFTDPDERTDYLKFGNDWCKAAFVAIGNAACVAIIFSYVSMNFDQLTSFKVLLLILFLIMTFELSLLFYGFFISYRFDKVETKISEIHIWLPAYKSTIFIRMSIWLGRNIVDRLRK